MRKPTIIIGLDIGSSKVAAVAVEINRENSSGILAHATHPSKGVSRGTIVDLDEVVNCVSKVLMNLSNKISKRPDEIYVNISSAAIKGEKSRGMIPLSLRGREVTQSDIDRCINVASTIQLPFDREILHKIVHTFWVDDQGYIKNPLGLYASRLSCETYIITANVNNIQNIYKCVNSAGYDVKEVIFTGIADGAAVLDSQEKAAGCVLLDMGATLTIVSIFFGGVLNDLDIISVGAEDVKGDFKESLVLDDALSKINTKCEEFLKKGGKINSVVLTGGVTFRDEIIDFLEGRLSYPIKIGVVKGVRGDISSLDSMKLTTAIGLAKYAQDKYSKRFLGDKGIVKRLSTKLVDIFNNYF